MIEPLSHSGFTSPQPGEWLARGPAVMSPQDHDERGSAFTELRADVLPALPDARGLGTVDNLPIVQPHVPSRAGRGAPIEQERFAAQAETFFGEKL